MDTYFVKNETVDLAINLIADRIEESKINFSRIIGIVRGGLHISKPLSSILNLPHSEIKISFYDKFDKLRKTPYVNTYGWEPNKKETVLIVDDLIDSGSTIKYFKKKYKVDHKVAVMFNNKKADQLADFWAFEKPDQWITFPWELNQVNV